MINQKNLKFWKYFTYKSLSVAMEEHILDTNAGNQLSEAATDV
jgi:hypothetical protein